MIDSPNPEGPFPRENVSYHRAKCCWIAATFPATGAVFLALPTLHSESHQNLCYDRTGKNKPTCLESLKMLGRYQANIMPCMSTIMHGIEAVTPFSGGYRRLSDSSLSFDAFVPDFEGFFGSLSA